MKKSLLTLIALLLFITELYPQNLEIFEIDTSSYPIGKARFFAFDENYEQLMNLQKEDIEVYENGEQREVLKVLCPPELVKEKLSSVLVIGTAIEKEYIQAAGNAWVNFMEEGSDCAVTSFASENELVKWFTDDKDSLIEAINDIVNEYDISYNAALIDENYGGLRIAKEGINKRIVVFINNGSPSDEIDINTILEMAKQNDIIVYNVCFHRYPNEYIDIIAQVTGGKVYKEIRSVEKLERVLWEIFQTASIKHPCEVQYQSENFCECRMIDLNIKIPEHNLTKNRWFSSPYNSTKRLSFNVPYLTFGETPEGGQTDTTITVTALNSDISIQSIESTHPDFNASPQTFNLKEGESKKITVTYKRRDTAYLYEKITIKNNVCDNNLLILTNFDRYDKPYKDSIVVIQPNGGEALHVGDKYEIKWKGIIPKQYYKIEYSTDNGASWNEIASYIKGNSYLWEDIPQTISNKCLIRVTSEFDKRVKQPIFELGKGFHDSSYLDFFNNGSYIISDYQYKDSKNKSCYSLEIWDICKKEKVFQFDPYVFAYNMGIIKNNSQVIIPYNDTEGRHYSFFDIHDKKNIYDTIDVFQRAYIDFSYDGSLYHYFKQNMETELLDKLLIKDAYSQQLKYFEKFSYTVSKFGLSFDSEIIATSETNSNNLFFRELKTYNILKVFEKNNYNSFRMKFNPIENKVYFVEKNRIYVYDSNNFNEIKNFEVDNLSYSSLYISNDGNIILSNGMQDIKVSRIDLGKTYFTYSRSKNLNEFEFSPQDLIFGHIPYDYPSFNIIPRPNISDISNSSFSIVMPLPAGKDLFFGGVLLGTHKDTTVTRYFENTGTYKLTVEEMNIIGDHSEYFKQIDNFPPFELAHGEGKDIRFRFTPEFLGQHSAIMEINTTEKTLSYHIIGVGVLPELQLLSENINFGLVGVNNYKDVLNRTVVRNKGTAPLQINSLTFEDETNNRFELLEDYNNLFIEPEEKLNIDLRFSPKDIGVVSNILKVHYKDTINKTAKINILGTGGVVNPMLRIGEHEAYSGEKINIPIYLDGAEYINLSRATSFSTDLIFNPTMLLPINENKTIIDKTTAKLSLNNLPIKGENNIIRNLEFYTALGNSDHTLLELSNYEVHGDDTLKVAAQSGEFKLLGVCYEGGTRLFNQTEIGGLKSIKNDLYTDKIIVNIELIETGYTEIMLYNLLGEKVSVPFAENVTDPGAREIIINTETINSGNYLLIYRTPSSLKSFKIMVVK